MTESCEIVEPPEMPDSPFGLRGHQGVRERMADLRDASAGQAEEFIDAGDRRAVSSWLAWTRAGERGADRIDHRSRCIRVRNRQDRAGPRLPQRRTKPSKPWGCRE